ncbi:unnamed protein product, partial [Rotaria magnacalcarata]
QNENNKKKYEYDQLQNQIKILNEELRIVKRDFDQLMIEKNDLSEKFLQFDLYTTLSDKLIKKLNDEKEDYLVEENLLHIELKRLKNILFASSEINLTLEQQKIELHKVFDSSIAKALKLCIFKIINWNWSLLVFQRQKGVSEHSAKKTKLVA